MADRETILRHIETSVDLDEWAIIGVKESFEELEELQKENEKLKESIKALGEDMRKVNREKMTTECRVGFNMAIALTNKHLGKLNIQSQD